MSLQDITRHPGAGRPGRARRRQVALRIAGQRQQPPTSSLLTASLERTPRCHRSHSTVAARPATCPPAALRVLRAEVPGGAAGWAAEHRDALRAAVAEHGAVLVRGLGLRDARAGRRGVPPAGGRADDRAGGLRPAAAPTPSGVYSSTKWPANQPMCMHHELSYPLEVARPDAVRLPHARRPPAGRPGWPTRRPCSTRCRPKLVERFEREGWLLTRSYNDEIGASVAEAFGTDDRAAVEALLPGQRDRVRVAARRRAAHPAAPQRGGAAPGHRPALLVQPDRVPQRMDARTRTCASTWSTSTAPTGCRSTPASATATRSARTSWRCSTRSTRPHTLREPWQAGDLMLVDNVRTAHSREPFEGPREVLVGDGRPGAHDRDAEETAR